MKRIIRINRKDGTFTDLELSRAVSVKTSKKTINLEELPDGSWRMIWNESLIPDFTQVANLEIIRED